MSDTNIMTYLFTSRFFWIGVIILLIFSIIFDLVVLNYWALTSVSSGKWDERLLVVALGLIVSDAFGSIFKKWKTSVSSYTRLLFIMLVIFAIYLHGFWNGIVFMSMVLILSRLLRLLIWVFKKGMNKFRRRGLLEEI